MEKSTKLGNKDNTAQGRIVIDNKASSSNSLLQKRIRKLRHKESWRDEPVVASVS